MAFQERFKGKTSLIDKEGIIGIVKSQSQPITKKNVDFASNVIENDNSEKKKFKIVLKNQDSKNKNSSNDANFKIDNINQEQMNENDYIKNKKMNNFIIKSVDQGNRKYVSHSSSPVKIENDLGRMQLTSNSVFHANNNNSVI
jgi:hypothetical protein